MKKLSVLFATALFVALSFVSCKKDDNGGGGGGSSAFDGKLSGTIVNVPAGTGDFTMDAYYDNSTSSEFSTNVHNGAFSMALPTPSSDMLYSVSDDMPESMQMSDPNTLGTGISFEAEGTEVRCVSTDNPITQEMGLLYVDRDVTITGSQNQMGFSMTYNVSLKRGWNKVLQTATNTSGTWTTGNIPSNLVWKLDINLTFAGPF